LLCFGRSKRGVWCLSNKSNWFICKESIKAGDIPNSGVA
jgi:hypothetical protein